MRRQARSQQWSLMAAEAGGLALQQGPGHVRQQCVAHLGQGLVATSAHSRQAHLRLKLNADGLGLREPGRLLWRWWWLAHSSHRLSLLSCRCFPSQGMPWTVWPAVPGLTADTKRAKLSVGGSGGQKKRKREEEERGKERERWREKGD